MQPHPDRPAPPEEQLVTQIRSGDVAAFAVVFRAYYMPIVRFLYRYTRSQDNAEDIAQDVLLRVWERRETLDPARSLKAYLFTSARNQALDAISHDQIVRDHTEQTLQELGPNAEVSTAPTPDELVLADELAQLATDQVASLSPRLREIYHLSRDQGLSAAEIAEVLHISVNTVYVQYAKLLKILHPTFEHWMRE